VSALEGPPGSLGGVDGVEALRRRLAEVRGEIAAASEQLQQLRDEEYGLSLSLTRMTGASTPTPQRVESSQVVPSSGRARITPTVRTLLAESPCPLTRVEIAQQLVDDGVRATPDAVSASLSYLRRQGVASNAGGRWYLSPRSGSPREATRLNTS
jgi:hypothetical protein